MLCEKTSGRASITREVGPNRRYNRVLKLILHFRLRRRIASIVSTQCPAPVWKVVAVDTGDDGMPQTHCLDCFAHVFGLVRSIASGRTRDGAIPTRPGTNFTQNHESRRFMLTPALPNIWAAGLFANGVQRESVEKLVHFIKSLGALNLNSQPWWPTASGPCLGTDVGLPI